MDAKTAEALLVDINNSKEAEEFSGLASWLPDMSAPSPVGTQLVGDIGQQAHNNAVATTIKLLLSGAGAGAAMRGFSGLRRLMSPTVQNTAPTQTVEMPVTYPRSPKSPKTTEKRQTQLQLGVYLGFYRLLRWVWLQLRTEAGKG